MRRFSYLPVGLGAFALLAGFSPVKAAQVQLLQPLGRTDYQTNEIIDISAVRSDTQALAAGNLVMNVTGADGSKMSFTFPVVAAPVVGGSARHTENLHLSGYLLKPGAYTVDVASDGATATTAIKIYPSVRKSTYKTIHWGGPSGAAMVPEGENGVGFNVILTQDAAHQEPSIAGGTDIMGCCLMGGGHQMDLRSDLDWSDPNVYLGAVQRGINRAFGFRTLPNAIGAHLYDEPGLTWLPNPHYLDKSGNPIANDQDIPEQIAAYKRAFGKDPVNSWEVKPDNAVQFAQWEEQNDFKLGFMDATWKASYEAIQRMKPSFMAITQSQYGWCALFDGYYFNVARSLPLISGHGGYDNYWMMNFNPSFYLEFSLPRQMDKPNWYLPEWGIPSGDEYRLEHNMSFITGIQGMSTPPTYSIGASYTPTVTAVNQLYQKIGTIFTKPEYTNQDVAILYSKSNQYYLTHNSAAGLGNIYLATKLDQYPIQPVLEEDILDGTLAANHKAVIVTGVVHLDAPVIAGLEDFIRHGGVVLETSDCKGVNIAGAVQLGVDPDAQMNAEAAKANAIADLKAKAAAQMTASSFNSLIGYAKPVAAVLKEDLEKAGIKPTFESSVPTIAAGKQVRGDIEYDFAVNFTMNPTDLPADGGVGVPAATTAKITLPDDGRPVYDAVTGKELSFSHGVATLHFEPGQMYVFARPIHAIGGVQVGVPVVNRDFTRETDPQHVRVTASLVDAQQRFIAGSAPMQITITDPLGAVRYNLYRCADNGQLDENVPLAANDAAGTWTVEVTELLSGTHGESTFAYHPAASCGAIAGMTARGVVYGADIPNIYHFFRDHRNVTIVPGSSAWDAAAAQRLINILKPYDVNCTIESATDANTARPITDQEALTWVGNTYQSKPLDGALRKDPTIVGYNLPGATILVGNAADNPLIAYLQNLDVFPYKPTADFPGVGHGMIAWNDASLGHDIEDLALIGNDEQGVNEAVGTAFQYGIGVDPLTTYAQPTASSLVAATIAPVATAAAAH